MQRLSRIIISFSTLIEAFLHQVDRRPDATALIARSSKQTIQPISWTQLSAIVARFVAKLSFHFDSDSSLPRRIGHASDNTLADIVIALASMSVGAIEVPIDQRLGEEEVQRRWNRVGGLWIDRDSREHLLAESLADVKHDARENGLATTRVNVDAPSLILWTSGTTGTPQGVILSQRNLLGNAAAKLAAVAQRTDDVRLCVLPLSHAYARTCDFGTWLLSGCTLASALGYGAIRQLAPVIRPTLINVVPSLAVRLLQEDPATLGLDRLRLLGCGGAPISESIFGEWKKRGVTVIQGYGLTETSPVICSATPDNASPGLVGRFVHGWENDIREGQLFVRGPHNMLGYWGQDDATAKKIDGDGWLATGDFVEQDAATGQLRILGRADDVIVLDSGSKVFPLTIEREVEQIAGVQHAFLTNRGRLQLWFDAEQDSRRASLETAILQLLAKYPHCHDCAVHRFTPSLCEASGELTAKGTICRTRILENRFLHQAGS